QPVKVAKNAPSNPPKPTPTPPKTGPADSTPTVPPLSAGARTEDENNTIDVFRAAAPATVFVSQSQVVIDRWQRRAEVPAGAGTGFVWDNAGHVVTNCHVALPDCNPRRASKLTVTLYNQKTHPAELVGIDRTKDIAVLRIQADPGSLTPLARPPAGYGIVRSQERRVGNAGIGRG